MCHLESEFVSVGCVCQKFETTEVREGLPDTCNVGETYEIFTQMKVRLLIFWVEGLN